MLPSAIRLSAPDIILEFVSQCDSGRPPALALFLAPYQPVAHELLGELVQLDMQYRWGGEPKPVTETYLALFPELTHAKDVLCDIVYTEYLLCESMDSNVATESFVERFPSIAPELRYQFLFHRALDGDGPLGGNTPFPSLHTRTIADDAAQTTSPEDVIADLTRQGFEIRQMIGSGGMSMVYEAVHPRLKRSVAVKVVLDNSGISARSDSLRREINAVSQLDHPNIIGIHDVILAAGKHCLVLEYYPEGSLVDRFRGRPSSPIAAARFVATLAETVQYCHQRGVFHRDLKPGNVLLMRRGEVVNDVSTIDDFVPKLTDFGLSRTSAAHVSEHLTAPGTLLGTAAYMAPEQVQQTGEIDLALVDVYGLGAILYELLTGRPPFQGTNLAQIIHQALNTEPISPLVLQRGLPRDLETICMKCLAKRPNERYADCQSLAEDLRLFATGQPIRSRPLTLWRKTIRWGRRHPAVVSLFTFLAILCTLGIVAGGYHLQTLERNRIEQLVASLPNTSIERVMDVIHELAEEPSLTSAAIEKLAPEQRQVLPLLLARASLNEPVHEELSDLLLTASPDVLRVATDSPLVWPTAVVVKLRTISLDEDFAPTVRVRAAALLAATQSLETSDWSVLAPWLSHQLAQSPPAQTQDWAQLFTPVKAKLIPTFVAAYSMDKPNSPSRAVMAGVLSDWLADVPIDLCRLILSASPVEFELLASKQSFTDGVREFLLEVVGSLPGSPPDVQAANAPAALEYLKQKKTLSIARANAAILLALHESNESLLKIFGENEVPTARSFAIEAAGACGLSPGWFAEQLRNELPASTVQACLLALGQVNFASTNRGQIIQLAKRLQQLDETLHDPGVTASRIWLWEHQIAFSVVPLQSDVVNQPLERMHTGTWTNSAGITFSLVKPQDAQLGSPDWEEEHEGDEAFYRCVAGPKFWIAQTEITIGQLRKWDTSFPINLHYASEDDEPANNISFFDAARFCRWMSEQDNVPEDQMCFPPSDQIGPAMVLPQDYQQRTGYRLALDTEWEYACRAGSQTSWHFGDDLALYGHYSNSMSANRNHSWRVRSGKPNSYGLFDMHGNQYEWCANVHLPEVDSRQFSDAMLMCNADDLRSVRGGSWGDVAVSTRSARLFGIPADARYASLGIRLVRTAVTTE